MTSRDLGWRRPMSAVETSFFKNNINVSYVLRLCTSRELTQSDVIRALVCLYRITPNLRMAAQERDGRMWMKEMVDENIDLEVVENADPRSVLQEMLVYSYFKERPYWAARFLPWSATQQDYVNLTKMEAEQKHPYICHLVFSFNHYLTDGFTILRTVRILLGLLDDVIADRPIDDHTQVAELIDTKHEQLIYEEIEQKFLDHPQLLEQTKCSFESFITDTMISKAYPAPESVKPATISLPYVFDKKSTQSFLARCKCEKVSFHAAFCSVIDAAIVKFLSDSNLEEHVYKISSRHAIDHRQYLKNSGRFFGCCMGAFDMTSDTPKDVLQQFWSHAKEFHANLKIQQRRKASFLYEAMCKLTGIEPSSRIKKANPPVTGYHYSTTNMLDVTSVVGDCGAHVSLDYYDRLATAQMLPIFWLSGFQTFRGQLLHSFMYNTHLMTAAAAQKMANNIQEIFAEVVTSI